MHKVEDAREKQINAEKIELRREGHRLRPMAATEVVAVGESNVVKMEVA
jgi:hypothetical protein